MNLLRKEQWEESHQTVFISAVSLFVNVSGFPHVCSFLFTSSINKRVRDIYYRRIAMFTNYGKKKIE